ncbi:ABC transporter permease [Micromonospora sagamiensis]|uniref:Monosaccharide ABC transporter membrane protein, CUT2 family (TC 3.A.1.2.-) n=1 Tax=Micromonospora sagamiensis TaxID=47875 RepID=A0A562WFS1_9ACTN|nr:ABC transporter permease [Micromonospora sagamiensis]TWJ28985.1 monosaccharide ABC transporter membrane protein, CUT2 family (TC 3.A.1.2.-) [Micromonospora sagamiensis]BCL17992.1 sugar ABC transporter permease [Micromonospora sagamiensis]
MSTVRTRLAGATGHRLFWPIVVLLVLLAANAVHRPSFLAVEVKNGHLYGSLIDIVRLSAPLILVALGMSLVIATGGIDLSVGSVVAVSGAVACLHISRQSDQDSLAGVLTALALALGVALLLGAWNGVLVAVIGIQPIIATLILMVAGRGLAQLITSGQIITVNSGPYRTIGVGHLLTLPFAIVVALAVTLLVAVLTRRTALGTIIEAVGGNAEASRLAGIRSARITFLVYVVSAACAAVAGFMMTANVSSADGNAAGLWVELDAILAVVIGGTALAGGRFHLGGTIVGALIIQTLTTSVYAMDIDPQTALLFKAVVVIAVCLIQAPAFRARFRRRSSTPAVPPVAGAETQKEQVPA